MTPTVEKKELATGSKIEGSQITKHKKNGKNMDLQSGHLTME